MRSATRSTALRARGLRRDLGVATASRARPTSASGGGGRSRGAHRQAARRGSPANGCDARHEALHDAVLERVEADHGEPPARREQRDAPAAASASSSFKLPIDENPKSLKGARRRILRQSPRVRAPTAAPRAAASCRVRAEGLARPSRNNRSCNRFSKPFFTIVADHLPQFALRRRGRAIRRRTRRASCPCACRADRRGETRSRARRRRAAARRRRDRAARRRRARAQAPSRTSGSSENHARRKTKRGSCDARARARAAAAGSRSSAIRRPARPSARGCARAWPPRPKVAST